MELRIVVVNTVLKYRIEDCCRMNMACDECHDDAFGLMARPL